MKTGNLKECFHFDQRFALNVLCNCLKANRIVERFVILVTLVTLVLAFHRCVEIQARQEKSKARWKGILSLELVINDFSLDVRYILPLQLKFCLK